MRHDWFRPQPGTILSVRHCSACGLPDCTGRILIEACPVWQEAQARWERGEYLQISDQVVFEVSFDRADNKTPCQAEGINRDE